MSVFDRIKSAFWETGFIEELAQHFDQMGVKSSALPHGSPEAIHHTPTFGIFGNPPIGSLKLYGRSADFVEVYRKPVRGSRGPGQILYSYLYVVRINIGNQDDFNASTEPFKKGLLKRETIGFDWKGGRLASALNSDVELKRSVIEIGFPDIRVRANKRDGYVGIGAPVRWDTLAVNGVPVKHLLMVGKNLPSRESFDVFDEIARQVRGLPTSPS
ncbi:MAG: hypothetical protein HY247_03900 [archaeon]|nr:MAG: hypothetical protein HY247_03900 [archaeon]